ncbi:LAME_0D04962g1_1 [Lachancea meyersii CBS 8951]|uniref:LAME_0D04962g1_1 n=1 Tax=Lachancea meyersii CBS 8951 TaxID=1266667 RepID=A0A1G4J8B2_9SACH|nr:LAME_0D04962g1_1 [Lachancea meyersii CBS 8951]
MLPHAVFTVAAIIWLSYRLVLFLGIPVWRIVSTLGLQVPQTTRVSIDDITEDTITIRWENEPTNAHEKSSSSIACYMLYLNNVKIGTIPNITTSLYTCCSLQGLSPQTQYQFDFVCVNEDGFKNKVPSIYVMTKPQSTGEHTSQNSLDDLDAKPMLAPNFPAEAKWRKSQVAVYTESPTSYASLTSLQDLDDFSITDLKYILVCAQEDLHDVLQQEASILQDFHESEEQLKLELDNLRAQWAHEIDLRKSLKSSIKSLENSKLLYDLKRGKLDKNIDQSANKIQKMKNDMAKWDQEKKNQLRQDTLLEKFNDEKKSLLERIDQVSAQVKELHSQVSSQEEENKKLSSAKKSMDSSQNATSTTTLGSSTSSKRDSPVENVLNTSNTLSLDSIFKKIHDFTNDKTGILSNAGHEFLNSLGNNSVIAALVRDELKKDVDLENQWRAKKLKMKKRNEMMESLWSEISIKNRELMAALTARPYVSSHQDSPDGSTPHLTLHDPSTYTSGDTQQDTSAYAEIPFRHASPAPHNNLAYSNWNMHNQNGHQMGLGPEDHHFDYDSSHHLLSGLQNMISEAEYQATNVSTSKLYTTDQLDNYWSRQTAPDFLSQGENASCGTQPARLPLLSSSSISEPHHVASHMRMLSNDSFGPLSMPREEDLSGFVQTPLVQRDDVISFGSGYNNDPATRTSPLSLPMKEEIGKDSLFGTNHFNNIWNNSSAVESPTVEKLQTPKSQHNRSNSRGSWGLPHFMQKSPKSTQGNNSTAPSTSESKDRETHGGERRVSKLLTKSGMNHLFRSPTHETP